jgi:hypothetical protein
MIPESGTSYVSTMEKGDFRAELHPHAGSDTDEVIALAQGLVTTRIHTLTLSVNLNGLHRARLPSPTSTRRVRTYLSLSWKARSPMSQR